MTSAKNDKTLRLRFPLQILQLFKFANSKFVDVQIQPNTTLTYQQPSPL